MPPLTDQSKAASEREPTSPVGHVSLPPLRELFAAYAPFVWRGLRHLGVRTADLEDACQEVFLTVHRRAGSFAGHSSVRTWIYGICLRVASDFRRKAHIRRELPEAEPPLVAVPETQFDICASKQQTELLANLLQQLDTDKREVFVLFELEELSMQEVAEAVGCPLQTAYSRLSAARKFISQQFLRSSSGVSP